MVGIFQEQPSSRRLSNESIVTIIIAIGSLLLSGYVSYSHNDKDITSRIVKVETKQEATDENAKRMENKIDNVDHKLDRLVEWALGKSH